MKVLKILLLPFLMTVTLFCSCKSVPDLTENEVYTIVNQIIADNRLTINKACWKFQDINLTDEYSKEFTDADISFIKRQKDFFKNIKIKPQKIKWFRRRNKTYEYAIIDTLCNQGILYHISFPLISIDRKKVLIEFQEDCNCMLGGQGGKDLYEKKDEHWVKTKSFDRWIGNIVLPTKDGSFLSANYKVSAQSNDIHR